MIPKILIVDDEQNLRKVLSSLIKRLGFEPVEADNGFRALEECRTRQISTVITDLRMLGMDGLDLLRSLNRNFPHLPVIMLTAHGTIETAVSALKNGAFDYITKPFEQLEMKRIILNAINTFEANQKEYKPPFLHPDLKIIGKTSVMEAVFSLVKKVADSPSSVLIIGESGTGKELIAQALHNLSSRKDKPFIKVNCAAIPENLIESELFGYEKGAFTGALNSKPGRFELAHEGTIFLDEIGEIPLEMQVKLLRVLQEKEFDRIGGLKTIEVDIRLISATNSELEKKIQKGAFREDLFYRLNVVPIQLPPLRERKEDIPLLVNYFLDEFNKKLKRSVQRISPDIMEAFSLFYWPGNIRQLENVIERMVLLTPTDELTPDQLPQEIKSQIYTSMPEYRAKGLKEAVKETTHKMEKELILEALQETSGNVTQAARQLGISRKSLQLKMKEFDLREKL